MTHRTPAQTAATVDAATRGSVIADAVCAPIVIGLVIPLVANVFDQVSATAGFYARWAFFAADVLWGATMLFVRLHGLRSTSVEPHHERDE